MNEIKRLITFQKKHKKTYEQMGRDLGISTRTVYRWIKGKSTPHHFLLEKILSYVEGQEPKKEITK